MLVLRCAAHGLSLVAVCGSFIVAASRCKNVGSRCTVSICDSGVSRAWILQLWPMGPIVPWHVESSLDPGLNLCPLHCKQILNHWTFRNVPPGLLKPQDS